MSLREHRAFKILTRPIVALAIFVGVFVVMFPNWGPRDLSLYVRLPPSSCASELTASAYPAGSDVLARSTKRPLDGARDLEATFSLPRAEYRVIVELGCSDGRPAQSVERTVDVHQHAELSLDLSRKCPCAQPNPG
jgi:hypothetical protein